MNHVSPSMTTGGSDMLLLSLPVPLLLLVKNVTKLWLNFAVLQSKVSSDFSQILQGYRHGVIACANFGVSGINLASQTETASYPYNSTELLCSLWFTLASTFRL